MVLYDGFVVCSLAYYCRYECQCADDLTGLPGISNDTSTCAEHVRSCDPGGDVEGCADGESSDRVNPEKRHDLLIPSNRFDFPVSLNKE